MSKINKLLSYWLVFPLVMLAAVAQLLLWAVDRKPPFEVLITSPATAAPGGAVVIEATVRRDTQRGCSTAMTRSIVDSRSTRWDMEGRQQFGAGAIANLERIAPGRMKLGFTLPPGIAVGPASLVTTLEYNCNPTHALRPIEVLTVIPFTVVAKE